MSLEQHAAAGGASGEESTHVRHFWPEHCGDVEHVEPHVIFYYLILGLTLGMLTYKFLDWLEHHYRIAIPYTVAIFTEGMILGLFHYELEVFKVFPASWAGWHHGPFPCSMHHSINLWVGINPHLLLIIFLPILLMGDSMGLNWTVLKGCFSQCLLLATVGVGIGAVLFAVVARFFLPYNWGWWTCMTFGSILSATDPVAVVGLLNDLGCSKVITMQIAGESLFNDGIAMVFFHVAKAFMMAELRPEESEDPSAWETLRLINQLPLGGGLFGLFLGTLLCYLIQSTSNKFAHENDVLQLSSLLVVAYWGYYIGDWEFEVSGVIAVIVAAFCFGRASWPLVTDQHGMHAFWHMLEFLGNTLIFFLAGTLFARSFEVQEGEDHRSKIESSDWCLCVLMYVMAIVIRGLMIGILYLPLKGMGMGTNPKDAAVMVWGGLRGAVGLALAMNVDLELGREVGKEFMFMVGGIACFTLTINASTCGLLVKKLGMTQQTWAKMQRNHLIAQHQKGETQRVYSALSKTVRFKAHNREMIRSWVSALKPEPPRTSVDGARQAPALPSIKVLEPCCSDGKHAPVHGRTTPVPSEGKGTEGTTSVHVKFATSTEESRWSSREAGFIGIMPAPLAENAGNTSSACPGRGAKEEVQLIPAPHGETEATSAENDGTTEMEFVPAQVSSANGTYTPRAASVNGTSALTSPPAISTPGPPSGGRKPAKRAHHACKPKKKGKGRIPSRAIANHTPAGASGGKGEPPSAPAEQVKRFTSVRVRRIVWGSVTEAAVPSCEGRVVSECPPAAFPSGSDRSEGSADCRPSRVGVDSDAPRRTTKAAQADVEVSGCLPTASPRLHAGGSDLSGGSAACRPSGFGFDSDAPRRATKAALADVEVARLLANSSRSALTAEERLLYEESLPSERELFYSVVRSGYWEMMNSGMLPDNSKAVLRLLNAVDWAELHPDAPVCDFGRLLSQIQGGRWMGFQEGTFHMREMIPIRRQKVVFDLFDIVIFMDAHEAALRHVASLKTELDPPALKAAMAQVAFESRRQIAEAKKFLEGNNIGEEYLSLARTLQLALHLLYGAKRRVHDLIRMGGVTENDLQELIATMSHDSESLYDNVRKSTWVDECQDDELVCDFSDMQRRASALARGEARHTRYSHTCQLEQRRASTDGYRPVLSATE